MGFFLLLWPTLTALWLAAGGWPGQWPLAVMLLGTFCMRSAGCAINDRADKRLDARVSRTAERPLATGELSARAAKRIALALVGVSAALVMTLGAKPTLVAALSLPVVAAYPYIKRRSNYPQLVLGVAFSWGVLVAWVAAAEALSAAAAWLFAGTWCWIVAYDTQYAMCDRPYDVAAGVGSTAIGFGPHERLVIAAMQVAALAMWWLAGQSAGAFATQTGLQFFELALATAAALFVWQTYSIRDRDPAACLRAFNSNALVGAVVFAGAVLQHQPPSLFGL